MVDDVEHVDTQRRCAALSVLRDHAMVSIDDDSADGHVAREAENLDAWVERLSENDP